MSNLEKPKAVAQIENFLKIELHSAPRRPHDPFGSLMAFKENCPKFLADGEKIIGLNLAATGLDDEKWREIKDKSGIVPGDLQALNLSENGLTAFSPTAFGKLLRLDLSENKIQEFTLPPESGGLEDLDLELNPLLEPGPEVMKKGKWWVLEHLKKLAEAAAANELDYLFEAKVLLVGRTGAGKTSLRFKLRHPDEAMPGANESTRGIDVEPMNFELPGGQEFRMNIWDFEGQEISHQTHQFFLTKRSLYVFVADQRTEKSDIEYWFQIVQLLGENSPMIIFQNERKAAGDQKGQICQVNIDGLRQGFGNFLCEGEHRANLDFLAKGERHDPAHLEDFVAFRSELEQRLAKLPHVGEPLHRSWVLVRNELEKIAENVDHITLQAFWDLCKSKGIEDEKEQERLRTLFHDLGIFLNYQSTDGQPSVLSRIVILNNLWVTKAMYQVLKSDWLRDEKKGHFTINDLRKVWKGTDFARHADELLELMSKKHFEICYRVLETDGFIAPQLLPSSPPEDYRFPTEGETSLLRYSYDFMPKGLLTRLTVRMHPFIARNQTLAWKDGIVLENKGTTAEVIETYGLRQIHVRVRGKHGRKLLNQIGYEMDRLNDTYHFSEKMAVHKLLPCVCSVCRGTAEPHFFKYKELLVWKNEDWKQVPCGKTGKPAKLDELLAQILENDERAVFGFWKMESQLDDLLDGQKTTHSKLDKQTNLLLGLVWLTAENRKVLENLFSRLENLDARQQDRLAALLPEMERSFQAIVPQLQAGSPLAKSGQEALSKLEVTHELEHKLKLILPILPGILEYETEWKLSANPVQLLKKIWTDFRSGKVFTE